MNALVIGGSQFFGRHLVERLLAKGASVTLISRGHRTPPSGVRHIVCDRKSEDALAKAVTGQKFDVVFDQVCFDAKEARAACRVFADKTPLYIFTSTISVYGSAADLRESAFDPFKYKFTKDVGLSEDYGEGKRQAEAVFFQQAPFRVIAPRIPIICGIDDYTERLKFHVEHVAREQAFWMPNLSARMKFLSADEAAAAIEFLSTSNAKTPVNCSSADAITMRDLVGWVENGVGKKAIISKGATHSPYGMDGDFFADTSLCESLGFRAKALSEWLPALIAQMAGR